MQLDTVVLTTTGFEINPTAYDHIDVHWVGLFDAVSQMFERATAKRHRLGHGVLS